jgi:hypothetical protein
MANPEEEPWARRRKKNFLYIGANEEMPKSRSRFGFSNEGRRSGPGSTVGSAYYATAKSSRAKLHTQRSRAFISSPDEPLSGHEHHFFQPNT